MFRLIRYSSKGLLIVLFFSFIFITMSLKFDSDNELIGFDFGQSFEKLTNDFQFFKSHAEDFSKTNRLLLSVGNNIINSLVKGFDRFMSVVDLAWTWLNNNIISTVANGINSVWNKVGDGISAAWNYIFG